MRLAKFCSLQSGRFLVAAAILATSALSAIVPLAGVAQAATGDVTSTAFAPPASLSGALLRLSFSDGAGGSYQVYSQGQSVSIIRVTPTGTVDSAFNSGAPLALTLPSGLQSSGNFIVRGAINAKTNSWWVILAPQSSNLNDNVTIGLTLTSGNRAGAVSFTKTLAGATVLGKCTPFLAGATTFQTPAVAGRRSGGVWLSVTCGTSGNVNAASVYTPLDANGDFDNAAQGFSVADQHGSAASCMVPGTVVADPTSLAPAPELRIVRIEHNAQSNGTCATTTGGTNAAAIASNFVSLASLAIAADGTVTRVALPGTTPRTPTGSRIDPGGRMVFLTSELADTTKVALSRLNADGTLDAGVGTSGYLSIDAGALPSGATSVRASISGLITTTDRVYFVVNLYDQATTSYNNVTTPRTHGFRMGLVAPTSGWVSSFGTNGIGARVTTTLPENWLTQGRSTSTGASVDSEGQPVI